MDQIKEKFHVLTVKKSIKSWNNSDLNRSESFKPKFTKSDGRSNWRELEMEPGFGQEFKNWGSSDQLRYALMPSWVARFVIRNIAPFTDRSCSSGLNGSDLEQMSEWERMKTFPECHRHLNDASIVNLCTWKYIKHANTSKLPENHLLIHVSD